jgi:hypothetical protein
MGCHPSRWRTHIFQDGYCTAKQMFIDSWCSYVFLSNLRICLWPPPLIVAMKWPSNWVHEMFRQNSTLLLKTTCVSHTYHYLISLLSLLFSMRFTTRRFFIEMYYYPPCQEFLNFTEQLPGDTWNWREYVAWDVQPAVLFLSNLLSIRNYPMLMSILFLTRNPFWSLGRTFREAMGYVRI